MNNETQENADMNNEVQKNTDMSNEENVQYLTFTLDGELFATDIIKVREVLEHTEVTKVPRTPENMLGVINLRGSVVPVIDLRLQFAMQACDVSIDTCIIIIEVNIDGHSVVLGALTDSVQEVIELSADQMEPAPTLGTRVDNKFIQAMGKLSDDKFIIVVNLDQVFSAKQIHEAEKTGTEQDSASDAEAA